MVILVWQSRDPIVGSSGIWCHVPHIAWEVVAMEWLVKPGSDMEERKTFQWRLKVATAVFESSSTYPTRVWSLPEWWCTDTITLPRHTFQKSRSSSCFELTSVQSVALWLFLAIEGAWKDSGWKHLKRLAEFCSSPAGQSIWTERWGDWSSPFIREAQTRAQKTLYSQILTDNLTQQES